MPPGSTCIPFVNDNCANGYCKQQTQQICPPFLPCYEVPIPGQFRCALHGTLQEETTLMPTPDSNATATNSTSTTTPVTTTSTTSSAGNVTNQP